MNWETIQGNWKQFKGKVREQFGKLTDDELDVVAGKRDQLIGLIQKRYGLAKTDVERQLDHFAANCRDSETMEPIGTGKF